MKKELKVSLSFFILYTIAAFMVCNSIYSHYLFEYHLNTLILSILPALCLFLYDFAFDKAIIYNLFTSSIRMLKQLLKDVAEITIHIAKRTTKLFAFGFLAILAAAPILALGIYLEIKTNSNYWWPIAGILAYICFNTLFTHLNKKHNPDD